MFTVALASEDGGLVTLAESTDDLSDLVADIADDTQRFAGAPSAAVVRDRLVADAIDVGIDARAADLVDTPDVFDRLVVVNGDETIEYHLHTCGGVEFREVPRDGDGRWCKGAGCQGRGSVSVDVAPGPVSGAQADAAISDIATQIDAAGPDLEARAAVLSGLDSTGSASTMAEHDRIAGDRWTAEREALHNDIIEGVFAANADVPMDRKAIVVGGLPGAGKSSALARDDLDMNPGEFLHLDPDGIKQQLLDRNAVRRVPGMTDGEHAALLHEESSHIAARVQEIAVARGMNVIVDKTMGKPPRKELASLRANGYAVRGMFVDIPVDESHYSARQRWERGGRFIPPSYIESSRTSSGVSANRLAFESVASQFDDWLIVDNSGLGTPAQSPRGTVRRGRGIAEFAAPGMTVFRSSRGGTPRDPFGRWCRGGECNPAIASSTADEIISGTSVTVPPDIAVAVIEDLGQRPEASDLTKLTIAGHPTLYGSVADNQLRRVDMPQIPTAKLDGFGDYLDDRGVTTRIRRVDPADLRATQNELDGRKVGQMVTAMRTGTMNGGEHPLWASSDGRILDGHHRWAAEAALSVGESPRKMTIVETSAPMSTLLGLAREYNQVERIESKRHGMTVTDRVAQFAKSVPRDPQGQWCKGAACTAGDHSSPGMKAAHTKRLKAAAAAEPANTPSSNMPGPAELGQMEKIGGPLGSHGGQWYRDDDGQKYLVKPAPSMTHAHNELAAGLTYEHLGVPVNGTGTFEADGRWYVTKRAVDGKIVGTNPTPDIQMQARQGFHADTLTSSWDTFGLVGDNTLIGSDGQVYRIDVGGSNMFRAMGDDKPSFNPGKKWIEPTSMRTSNQGRKLYGNMSNAEAATQLERLNSVNLPALDSRLRSAGVSDAVRERTMATYEDRIVNQLPGILAELRSG